MKNLILILGLSEIMLDLKKVLFPFLILPLLLFSCENKKVEETTVIQPPVDTSKYIILKMNDPTLFLGGDFVSYFQTLYKLGNYDQMIKFTHPESIKKHGEKNLLEFYKNMNFSYRLLIHSKTQENDIITVNYATYINATRETKRFMVKVENDSCKIVLPDNLNDFSK